MTKSFTYTLLGGGPGRKIPYIEVPFDAVAVFGTKGRVPVKVTVSGVVLRMSLAPMGGRHVLGFNRALAGQAGIKVGDTVRVTLEKDDAPRTVEVPGELARALASNARAQKAWDALSYSHRREHAEAIATAKRPETKISRVQKAIAMLTTAGRPARPERSTKPLAERLQFTSGMKIAVLAAPKGFALGIPSRATLTGAVDGVLLFVKDRAAVERQMPRLRKLASSTALWMAYPKTTSKVETDLTRDAGWEVLEREGLAPVRQVAIDDTWSALQFKRVE